MAMMRDFYDREWEPEAIIYRLDGKYRSVVAKFDQAKDAIAILPTMMVMLKCTLIVETYWTTDSPIPNRCTSVPGTNEIVASYPSFLL